MDIDENPLSSRGGGGIYSKDSREEDENLLIYIISVASIC